MMLSLRQLVARMEAAGQPLWLLAAPWCNLPACFANDICWARAAIACVAENVYEAPWVLWRGQEYTLALRTLTRAVDAALALPLRQTQPLTGNQLIHHATRYVSCWTLNHH